MADERKTLKLKPDVYARLEAHKQENETWDGFFIRLVDEAEEVEEVIERATSLLESTVKCARCHAYLASAVVIAGDEYCRDCAFEVDPYGAAEINEKVEDEPAPTSGAKSYENYGGLREDTVWRPSDETSVTRWPLSIEQKWWDLANELGYKWWFGKATNRHNVGNDLLERERYFRQTPQQQRKWNQRTPSEFMAYLIRASDPNRPPYWNYSIESFRRDGWPEEILAEIEAILAEPESMNVNFEILDKDIEEQ
jgi:predicted CopG family antitoxin